MLTLKRLSLAALLIVASELISSGQDLFKLHFAGYQRYVNFNGKLTFQKLSELDLIRHCLGTNVSATNNPFELAYDATRDGIDVVQTNGGAIVCELWRFVTVVTNSDGSRLDRFVYLTDTEETNAVGSGVLTQKINHHPNLVSINGNLQFFFGTDLGNGETNSVVTTNGPVALHTNSITGTNAPPVVINNNTNSGTTNVVAITVPGAPTLPGSTALSDSSSTTPVVGTVSSNGAVATVASNILSGTVSSNARSGTVTSNALSGVVAPPLPTPAASHVAPSTLLTTKATLINTNTSFGDTNSIDASTSTFSAGFLPLNVTNLHLWFGTFSAGRRIMSSSSTNTF